ncbi:MAG: hypothetical protein CML06_14680 [Pseudomonadales bacterium]|nr:hypothetical protein [Pseudomonadales bacterium]
MWIRNPGGLLGALLLLMLLAPGAWGDTPVVVAEAGFSRHAISQQVSYLRDENARLEPGQALVAGDWQVVTGAYPAFGFDPAAYWLRFQLRNDNDITLDTILEIAYPLLDNIQLMVFSGTPDNPGALLESHRLGDRFPFHQRPLAHRHFAVPLSLAPAAERLVLLRVQTESSLQLPLVLWEKQAFYQQRQWDLVAHGLYFGVLLVMLLYNLVLFTSVRLSAYLDYAGVVLGLGLFMATLDGFGFQYLWPRAPQLNQWSLVFLAAIYGASACAFTQSLLRLREQQPRQYRWLQYCAMAHGCVFLSPFFLPYHLALSIQFAVALTSLVLCFSVGISRYRAGVREARYHILANGALLLGSLLITLSKIDLLPAYPVILATLPAGGMALVLFYALALADRINRERHAKILAQAQALKTEREARQRHEQLLRAQYLAQVEQLQSRQQVIEQEAESRAKSDFLATMSHEIRTPMTGLLGMAALLRETPLTAEQRESLTVIETAGQTLMETINNILDYSKLAAGKMVLERVAMDLQHLCRELVSQFQPRARQQGLEFKLHWDPRVQQQVVGDPARLRQILVNLLDNAFKFTPRGRISLMVGTLTELPQQVCFEIADTGHGIEPADQVTLFQPFVQGENSFTRSAGGSGLGLTISHQLSQLMGGRLSVESEPRQGSCFRLTLPLEPASTTVSATPDPAGQPPITADLSGFRVLVAEDNHVNQLVIRRLLERLGVPHDLVADGAAALATLEQQPQAYGLVLMDCEMPRLDGFAATSAWRQREQEADLPRLPVIALSAHLAEDLRQQARACGMDEILAKPIGREQLEAALRRHLTPGSPPADGPLAAQG